MSLECPSCGAACVPADGQAPALERCPSCGGELAPSPGGASRQTAAGYSTRHSQGLENAARIAADGGATTLFQPCLLDSSDASSVDRGAVSAGELPSSGTRVALSRPAARPPLRLAVEVYFLVLGAPPGEERIVLKTARTTFGREGADVDLADPTVSAVHFQVDVMGRELFVRDLGSRNGTLLNGHRIRYSELLPGDELQVGETVLVFRTSQDNLAARPR